MTHHEYFHASCGPSFIKITILEVSREDGRMLALVDGKSSFFPLGKIKTTATTVVMKVKDSSVSRSSNR